MATINLMMGETYLKQNSIVNENADMKVITPTINDVQILYVRKVLGTQLFNSILSQIGSNTVTSLNQTLLDSYILPFMKYYVLCELSPNLQYRYMNKGVMTASAENTQPVDLQTLQYNMDRWKNHAEELAQICSDYLCANTSSYPLYLTNTEIFEQQPTRNNYTHGLYLDDSDDDYCYRRGHN